MQKEYQKQWANNNKDKTRAYSKKWYAKNKDSQPARKRRYWDNMNPVKKKEMKERYLKSRVWDDKRALQHYKSRLKRVYGLTLEEYQEKMLSREGDVQFVTT